MFGWFRRRYAYPGPEVGVWWGFHRNFRPFGPWMWGESTADEIRWLERYKDRLELHKKDLEAEIQSVEERLKELKSKK